MERTPLQDRLAAQGGNLAKPVAIGDYRGAQTATRFADPQAEFSVLLNGCAIYDLGYRARISLTGGDRVRWLNGMVTNNIRDLAVGRGAYSFLLNPQGHILGDMYAYNLGESLVVETDRSQTEKIMATFDHYIIMDDVAVKDISANQTALGLSGSNSRALLHAVGVEVPEIEPLQMTTPRCSCNCDCLECTVVRGEDMLQECYELWMTPNDVLKTWRALVAAGATPVGSEALEMRRIAAGVPLYGVDIRERDLPQETEQMQALNFNKGCYVGQEIVERIRSRGNVHRIFTSFLVEGVAAVSSGAKILSGEKEVGEITSVAALRGSTGERTIALGYIRREIGVPGHEVTIGATKAKVNRSPLEGFPLRQADDATMQKV